MATLRGYVLKADKSRSRIESAAALAAAAEESTRLVWLDLEGDFPEETGAEMAGILGWHPLVLENFRLASSRPKLIHFDRYSQITLHALDLSRPKDESRTAEIDVVIAKNYLVTGHKHPVAGIAETLADVEAGRYAPHAPDELLHQLISRFIDKYVPEVESKRDLISGLEAEALFAPASDLLERIVVLRDEIMGLGLALAPQQLILAQLASGACRHVRPYVRPYFRDAESRMRNLIDELGSHKEMLANSLELYRSAMSSRTNDTMKVLTAMSALFLPLTFLTGLFGMNVDLPLVHERHAFMTIVTLCVVSFAGMTAYFKAKNWF
jgi:magnesium transporter